MLGAGMHVLGKGIEFQLVNPSSTCFPAPKPPGTTSTSTVQNPRFLSSPVQNSQQRDGAPYLPSVLESWSTLSLGLVLSAFVACEGVCEKCGSISQGAVPRC